MFTKISRNRNVRRGALAAVALGVVFAGVALAAKPPFSMTVVFARAEIQAQVVPVATCEGTDGTYTLLHVTGEGPITSTDPRLAGIEVVDALILDHPVTGRGVSTDNFKILDPVTRAVKATGTAWAVDAMPSAVKSLALMDLADRSKVIALATVTLPAPGSSDPIVIEYGGAGSGDSADRALIVSGDCAKMFKHLGFR